MTLSREQFLGLTKRRFTNVPLPTGGSARIRSLTVAEMREFRESFVDKAGKAIDRRMKVLGLLLIAQCLVDDDGDRILSEDDVFGPAMVGLDGAVAECLVKACKSFTGFANDGDWSAIEDAAKNSDATGTS